MLASLLKINIIGLFCGIVESTIHLFTWQIALLGSLVSQDLCTIWPAYKKICSGTSMHCDLWVTVKLIAWQTCKRSSFIEINNAEVQVALSLFWADGFLCVLFALLTHFNYTRYSKALVQMSPLLRPCSHWHMKSLDNGKIFNQEFLFSNVVWLFSSIEWQF